MSAAHVKPEEVVMTRKQVEEFFARRDSAHSRRDVDAVSALYAEDAVVESPTAGGSVEGRAAIEEITRTWFLGFPDVTFTRTTLVIDGDRAVWIGEVRGTDTGGFMGLSRTDKPFRLPMVMVCRLKDGAIVHEQRIYDFSGMLMQIGILKAKPL
jgi:ketosteroid isomerase-like protein